MLRSMSVRFSSYNFIVLSSCWRMSYDKKKVPIIAWRGESSGRVFIISVRDVPTKNVRIAVLEGERFEGMANCLSSFMTARKSWSMREEKVSSASKGEARSGG